MTKILIIESNEENIVTLKTLLSIIIPECSVLIAETGEIGIKMAVTEFPDTILLNEKVSRMDALEICKALKSNLTTKNIPLLISISGNSESRSKFMQNGADGIISKPIEQSELAMQIRIMIRLKHSEDMCCKEKDIMEALILKNSEALVEDKIKKSEARCQYLIEHANEVIAEIDKNGRFLLINKVGLSLIGEKWENFKSKSLYDVCEKEFADNSLTIIRKTIRTGKELDWREIKLFLKGELKYLSVCTKPVEDELGDISSVLILARNMTNRILDEKQKYVIRQVSQLILFSKNIENVFNKIPELLTANLNFSYAALEISNGEEEDAQYFLSESSSNKAESDQIDNIAGESIKNKRTKKKNSPLNSLKVKAFLCMPIKIDNKTFGSIFLADSRKRKDISIFSDTLQVISNNLAQEILRRNAESALLKSEEMLRHSQKMEAIGRLSGGISHDFNNLLTIITGYSESIMLDISVDEVVKKKVSRIKESAEKAGDLIQQLLAFSRKKAIELKIINLNRLILGIENMLKKLLGEDIILYIELDSDISSIKADTGQIEQVIMNLAINSRDAMPHGGNLIIETRKIHNDRSPFFLENGFSTEYVNVLKMIDNGNGIEPSVIKKIFDPFFTTKEIGKGTGLGLSTVKNIIDQIGGTIRVESKKEAGTEFYVYFPYITEDAATDFKEELAVAALQLKPPERGTETILVVEDQDNVREMICTMLEDFGYIILNARNGLEALDLMTGNKGKEIDLLLTDVIMPELNGYELAEKILKDVPDLKILYMSGYTDGIIDKKSKTDNSIKFIKKPFTTYELVNKIYKILNK